MNRSLIRSVIRESQNRLILKNKRSLKTLFQEVQRGHQAEIEIMRILLESFGVFDEAKEDTISVAENIGPLRGLKTPDSLNIGHGIPDYTSELEPAAVGSLGASSPWSSLGRFSERTLTSGKKLVRWKADTSVSSDSQDQRFLTKQSAAGKIAQSSIRKSRIERQANPSRLNKEKKLVLKSSCEFEISRNRNPGEGKIFSRTNSHLEEKKEHSEGVSFVINSKNNPNIPGESVSSSRQGEPSYFSLESWRPSAKRTSLLKRKEAISPASVLTEEKTQTDNSDSDDIKDVKSRE